jgi:hypothetical protein
MLVFVDLYILFKVPVPAFAIVESVFQFIFGFSLYVVGLGGTKV